MLPGRVGHRCKLLFNYSLLSIQKCGLSTAISEPLPFVSDEDKIDVDQINTNVSRLPEDVYHQYKGTNLKVNLTDRTNRILG